MTASLWLPRRGIQRFVGTSAAISRTGVISVNHIHFGDHAGAKKLEGATEWTMETVIYINAVSGWQTAFSKHSASTAGFYMEYERTITAWRVNINDGGAGATPAIGLGNAPTAGWYYLCMVRDVGNFRGYYSTIGLGGFVSGTVTALGGATIAANTANMVIGGNTKFNEYLDGRIAYVRLWNRPLPAQELAERFNLHLAPHPYTGYSGLVFHWDALYDGAPEAARELVYNVKGTKTGTVTRTVGNPPPLAWDTVEPRFMILMPTGGGVNYPRSATTEPTVQTTVARVGAAERALLTDPLVETAVARIAAAARTALTDPLPETTVARTATAARTALTDPLPETTVTRVRDVPRPDSLTDPLPETTVARTAAAARTALTDPLAETTVARVAAAARTALTDPLAETTVARTAAASRTALTDPLAETTVTRVGAATRTALTDPLPETTASTSGAAFARSASAQPSPQTTVVRVAAASRDALADPLPETTVARAAAAARAASAQPAPTTTVARAAAGIKTALTDPLPESSVARSAASQRGVAAQPVPQTTVVRVAAASRGVAAQPAPETTVTRQRDVPRLDNLTDPVPQTTVTRTAAASRAVQTAVAVLTSVVGAGSAVLTTRTTRLFAHAKTTRVYGHARSAALRAYGRITRVSS